jgi:uncharacterized protein YdeI (YjbR/CyaY-like superfamily)
MGAVAQAAGRRDFQGMLTAGRAAGDGPAGAITRVLAAAGRYSGHMTPTYFRTSAEFREWLHANHGDATELLVGFHKKASGHPSINWAESVDEALCFGWIDGVRHGIDDVSYTIRFSPRRPGSSWSEVNVRRARTLIAGGRMAPAGITAFEARTENRTGVYSYEQRPDQLIEPYAAMLARNPPAHRFFAHQTPSYRRAAIWWVISAKKDETRLERTEKLIELSARGRQIPQFLAGRPGAVED